MLTREVLIQLGPLKRAVPSVFERICCFLHHIIKQARTEKQKDPPADSKWEKKCSVMGDSERHKVFSPYLEIQTVAARRNVFKRSGYGKLNDIDGKSLCILHTPNLTLDSFHYPDGHMVRASLNAINCRETSQLRHFTEHPSGEGAR